jgi:hypothetical protein
LVNDTDADVAKRQQAMTEHVQRVLCPLGYAPGRVYLDAADTANVQLSERLQGREMNLGLERGDHVLIDRLEAFRSLRDLRMTVHLWSNLGVTFEIMAVPGLTTLGDGKRAILNLIDFAYGSHRIWLADRCRRGHSTRRRTGKLTNSSCGPGYRLAGRRGCRRKEPDEYERSVMRRIVEWRDKGATFRTLYFHLLKHKVRRSNGREWSEMAIRRAYDAEKRLRELETRATPDASGAAPDLPRPTLVLD